MLLKIKPGFGMNMEVKHINEIAVIEFSGHLSLQVGDYGIKKAITELLNNGDRKFLLQFDSVQFINSAGIGEIVGAYIAVSNRGGKIKLCGIPDKVYKMLKVTQLISIFETFKTREEALSSFK